MAIRLNGERIPESAVQFELDRLVKFYTEHLGEERVRAQMDALTEKAKNQAIGTKLLIDQANRLEMPVDESEVDARIGQMKANAGGAEAFERILRRQNMTERSLRDSVRQGRRVDKLVEKIVAEAREPTEAELELHFRNHSSEYRRPERVQVQHVLIKPATDAPADRQAAVSRLQEIRRRVIEGADFSDEAAMHSDCPSGKKSGGSLGWIVQGTLIPQVEEAVFSMAVGELSGIVESPLGLHLFRKNEQEESREADFDEVRDRVRDFLRHARRGELIAAYVEELRAKAEIVEE